MNIEAFLNIQIGARKLRDGKRNKNKNQFYWYEELYYIVKLTKDMWVIMEDCRKTRQLLRDHTWCFSSHGYAYTNVGKSSKCWHPTFLLKSAMSRRASKYLADHLPMNLRVAIFNRQRELGSKMKIGRYPSC